MKSIDLVGYPHITFLRFCLPDTHSPQPSFTPPTDRPYKAQQPPKTMVKKEKEPVVEQPEEEEEEEDEEASDSGSDSGSDVRVVGPNGCEGGLCVWGGIRGRGCGVRRSIPNSASPKLA